MATIADLRQSRQKLEMQAQQMVGLAEKYSEEKDKIASELKEQMIRSAGNRLLEKLSEAANVEFVNPSLKRQVQERAAKKP